MGSDDRSVTVGNRLDWQTCPKPKITDVNLLSAGEVEFGMMQYVVIVKGGFRRYRRLRRCKRELWLVQKVVRADGQAAAGGVVANAKS